MGRGHLLLHFSRTHATSVWSRRATSSIGSKSVGLNSTGVTTAGTATADLTFTIGYISRSLAAPKARRLGLHPQVLFEPLLLLCLYFAPPRASRMSAFLTHMLKNSPVELDSSPEPSSV